MPNDKDNQQERHCDYAWLAGIIDGEGSITFQTYLQKPNNTLSILPFICIVNSNLEILNRCNEIIKEFSAVRTIYRKPDSKGNSFKNKKPCHQLRIDGVKATTALIQRILPHLTGKKQQAMNLLKFMASRKENLIQRNAQGHIFRRTYTDEEKNLMIETKSLNRNESPTTIRLALQAAGKI